MESIFEVLIEIIAVVIFIYPGASYRWLISRAWNSKKTFKEFKEEDPYLNGTVGIVLTVGLVLLIINILK